jgi:hypothetical protein
LVQAVYDMYDTEPIFADVGDSPNCRFIFIGRYLFNSPAVKCDRTIKIIVTIITE